MFESLERKVISERKSYKIKTKRLHFAGHVGSASSRVWAADGICPALTPREGQVLLFLTGSNFSSP